MKAFISRELCFVSHKRPGLQVVLRYQIRRALAFVDPVGLLIPWRKGGRGQRALRPLDYALPFIVLSRRSFPLLPPPDGSRSPPSPAWSAAMAAPRVDAGTGQTANPLALPTNALKPSLSGVWTKPGTARSGGGASVHASTAGIPVPQQHPSSPRRASPPAAAKVSESGRVQGCPG